MSTIKTVFLERTCSQRTNDDTLDSQIVKMINSSIKGSWEGFCESYKEFSRVNGQYVFYRKVNFKKSNDKGNIPREWDSIATRFVKAGMAQGLAKFPWKVTSGMEDIVKGDAATGLIKDLKDYGQINSIPNGEFDHIFDREHQIKVGLSAVEAATQSEWNNRFHTVYYGPPGCHAKGTNILLSNGRTKRVEDITIEDTLCGPGGYPRRVLKLIRDKGQMYNINPVKGHSFAVNKDHILTLSRSRGYDKGSLVDVSVSDWLMWSKTKKSNYKLVRSCAVEFSDKGILPIDPYFIGIMLGDGSFGQCVRFSINQDDTVIMKDVAENIAKKFSLNVIIDNDNRNKNAEVRISGRKGKLNPITKIFNDLKLDNMRSWNKMIPDLYKFSSITDRKELLAGLIDSDGYMRGNTFYLTSKSFSLVEDVAFISRSLGLAAYFSKTRKKATNSKNKELSDYWTVTISGDISIIPTRLKRKRPNSRKQIKSVLRTGFTATIAQIDDYYGFQVDRDNRYLMGDFTITHNCGKTEVLLGMQKMLGEENDAYLKFDATSTTEAGASRLLLEAEHIPPILFVEEIEKANENSLRWLLGVLDQRAEIRRTNFRIGNQSRNVKMLCMATVNNMNLFRNVMSGALASRFPFQVFCPRPNRQLLEKILQREVAKVKGKKEWIEPALKFCCDDEIMLRAFANDPRKVVPVCLCGKDDLLTGKYQESIKATMPPEDIMKV